MSRWETKKVNTRSGANRTIVTFADGTKSFNRYEFIEYDNYMSNSWILYDKVLKAVVQKYDKDEVKKVQIETKVKIEIDAYRESASGYATEMFYERTVTRKYPVIEKYTAGKDFITMGMPYYDDIEIFHPEQIRD